MFALVKYDITPNLANKKKIITNERLTIIYSSGTDIVPNLSFNSSALDLSIVNA